MYSFDSKIRYSECDNRGKLSVLSLLEYFQDCSVFHSESRNAGVDFLKIKEHAWVLSSWQICLEKMPSMMEEVTISTWPYEMKGFYGLRNFIMKDAEEQTLAYANSTWVMIDTKTGKPTRIPDEIANKYEYEPALEMECSERKIKIPKEYEEKEPITVPSYFIDTNQHMNNGRYVQVALEYVPKDFEFRELCVEYKKAAVKGEVITPRVTIEEDCVIVVLAADDGKPYATVKYNK